MFHSDVFKAKKTLFTGAMLACLFLSSPALGEDMPQDTAQPPSLENTNRFETILRSRQEEAVLDFPALLEAFSAEDADIDPDGDPLTESMTALLREGDLLQRQNEMGRGLLLMDRQARFVEAAHNVINLLGPDANIEVAPGRFINLRETPVWYQAEIIRINQERELLDNLILNEGLRFEQQRESISYINRVVETATQRLPVVIEARREEIIEEAQEEALARITAASDQTALVASQVEMDEANEIRLIRLQVQDMIQVAQEEAQISRQAVVERRQQLETDLRRLSKD